MHFFRFSISIVLACLVSFSNLILADEHNALALVQTDLAVGKISEAQAIAYQLMAIHNPDKLPAQYKSTEPFLTRAGMTLKARAKALLPYLSTSEREMLEPLLQRPSRMRLPDTLISSKGYFKIHFTFEGADASDLSFVEETARVFDYVYDFEVGQLGYRPPVSDMGEDGPEYDIYLYNYPGYGETEPDNPSWIEMDNDFTSSFLYTKGLDGMRVTAAHEFFHMIQLNYHLLESSSIDPIFLFESTAVWMEDVAFDEINDYYQYLPDFFKQHNLPFNHYDPYDTHAYGLGIFWHLLQYKYGRDIVRAVWEDFSENNDPLKALDNTLLRLGSNFPTELAEFTIWNCFTGSRADTVHFYKEGNHYPEIVASTSFQFSNSHDFNGKNLPLACSYIKATPLTSGSYVIKPTFNEPSHWRYSLVYWPSEDSPSYILGGNVSRSLPDVRALSDVWVIPINIHYPESSYEQQESYQFTIALGNASRTKDEVLTPNPNPFKPLEHEILKFNFCLSRSITSDVYIKIITEQGAMVKRIKVGPCPDGLNQPEVGWDGRDEEGQIVASGIYLFYVEANGIVGLGKIAVIN
jgi:hypothetical protein